MNNNSGEKYRRKVKLLPGDRVDVYRVLDAFEVACPARQHAIKKLLCAGIRGKADVLQDLKEASDAIFEAISMEVARHVEAMEKAQGKQ